MRGRWRRARLPIALATIAVLAVLAPANAHLAVPLGPVTLRVEGTQLGDVTTSGLQLTPSFTASTTDYVLRCHSGANTFGITLTGASGGIVQVGSQSGTRVSLSVTLEENQALVLEATDPSGEATTSYWIRCLPSDFPALTVTKPGSPPPGWYLTGNLGNGGGSSTYAMILDSNGTPVWYQKTAGRGAIDVTPLARNAAAWTSSSGQAGVGADPDAAFSVFDLSTQQTRRLSTPVPPLDPHELLPLANGDYLLLASPMRAGMDLRALGLPRNQTIVDCLIEEVTAEGRLVWKWRASDHLSVAESVHPLPVTLDRQSAYDVFHCNSIDQAATGDLLLSVRQADAVYRISKRTGEILWKLGGNSVAHDGEQRLTVRRDSEGTFHGQHDARFQPNNDISLFDNHTWYLGAARGVEYHVDTRAGTATLVWQYASPDGGHSSATGAFRRYEQGNDNLVTWGFKPSSLFTEVDAAGNVLMDARFPNGDAAYRTIKTPLSEFDADLLHRTAGLPAASFPPLPRLHSLGVETAGRGDRSTVTITGSGFTGATSVSFGSASASSFSVLSDGSIAASAPPGSGTVGVTVTTPGGTSRIRPPNMLADSDGSFTTGLGSWKPNVNASVALSRDVSRSRPFSLALRPRTHHLCSALTSEYDIAGNAEVAGQVWARALRGSERVRVALIFYDELGSVLWIKEGRAAQVTDRWTRAEVSGMGPAGAASVALAVDGLTGDAALYLDDASLVGSSRFVYGGSSLAVTSVGPSQGTRDGGTVVTITGSGFSNATAVRFGASEARSFTVTSDSSITAVAPSGSGTVDVTVMTATGASAAKVRNVLTSADSTFESGPGSWIGNVGATALSSSTARTGIHSLESRPLLHADFQSVISGAYPAAAGAVYNLGLWVDTPGAAQHVRPFMIFYGPHGGVLSIEQSGIFTKTSRTTWTSLSLAARSPEGTVSVAVGVDDTDVAGDLYLDDVTLTGSLRFTYQ